MSYDVIGNTTYAPTGESHPSATRKDGMMHEEALSPLAKSGLNQTDRLPQVHFFYPDEGFGNVYRRSMLNDLFTNLIRRTKIQKVAEVPLESYGIIGAGSLVFTQLGCDITLISEEQQILDRAKALMHFNGISHVQYIHSQRHHIPVADNTFDLAWNFDELLPLADKEDFLREMCRIAKAVFVVVPNAYSYGQMMHHYYHMLMRTTCLHAGPRQWMHRKPIRDALRQCGMTIVGQGMIDVPWWPSFPELPNMVRRMLGRPAVEVDVRGIPETNPDYVRPVDVPAMRRKVKRSGFVERGRWPSPIKWFFAHNIYVIGCKAAYRQQLGL
jgi:hypothetical protein